MRKRFDKIVELIERYLTLLERNAAIKERAMALEEKLTQLAEKQATDGTAAERLITALATMGKKTQ